MKVTCKIMAYGQPLKNGAKSYENNPVIILELTRTGGEAHRFTVAGAQNISMNAGDRLKCVSGCAVVMINPGTGAGTFVLCPQIPPHADWKFRTELEINEETTKIIHRGKITFAKDIGGIYGATATTR